MGSGLTAGPNRIPRRALPGWAEGALIGVVSRVYSSFILVAGASWLQSQGRQLPWASPFQIWDAEWFVRIAAFGYHAAPIAQDAGTTHYDFAFFPAWPLVIRASTLGGIVPVEVAAPVAANLLFIAACALIYEVLASIGGRAYARTGLLLFAFSPAAYIFSSAYSEPLFLLAASAYFLPVLKPGGQAIVGAIGQLSRVTGVALAFAAIPELSNSATRRRAILSIATIAIAFAAWWAYISLLTGDPRGYLLGSPGWYGSGTTQRASGPSSLVSALPGPVPTIVAVYLAALLLGTWALLRKGHWQLGLFAAVCVLSAFLVEWSTMPRIASVAFPAFAALGAYFRNAFSKAILVVTFAVAQVVFALLAVGNWIVP